MVIVLSQTDHPSTERRDFEEELVAILLMKDGLEVSIIGDVKNIESESTDSLCLEGVRGDMFFVSWYGQAEAQPLLRQAGVIGNFGDTPLAAALPIASPGHYDPMQRQIDCLDLSQFPGPIDARRHILKSLDQKKKAATDQQTIASPLVNETKPDSTTKPMPKRQQNQTPADDLDNLLDAFDEIDL